MDKKIVEQYPAYIKYLTTAEAARMLEMTDSGIRRLIGRGKLKAKLYGKTYLIRSVDVKKIQKSKAGRPRKAPE